MITNEHVVSSSPKVDLMPPDGKVISAKVVKVDVEKDLALLKADTIRTTWLPVSEGKIQPNLGMRVFTIGYPDPMQQGVAQKFIDGKISSLSGMRDNDGYFQTSLAVQGGNSGGPLVDVQSGWVVGVVAMKLMATGSGNAVDTVSYAIKGRILHEFLKSEPAAYAAVTAKASTPVKAGDESAVIKSCEASAALVLVLK
jgi:S1-C subfamily serine protease